MANHNPDDEHVAYVFHPYKSTRACPPSLRDPRGCSIVTDLRTDHEDTPQGGAGRYYRILPNELGIGLKIFKLERRVDADPDDEWDSVGENAEKEFNILKNLKGAHGHAPKAFAYGIVLRNNRKQWAILEEHIDGRNLDEYIKWYTQNRAPQNLNAREALLLGLRIAEACDACYMREHDNAQIAHRDISPDNLRFCTSENNGEPDRAVLVDFGSAIQATAPDDSSEVLAKVKYGAPEMFSTSPRDTSISDAWAIGAMMYYARSLQIPFEKELDVYAQRESLTPDECDRIKHIKSKPVNLKMAIDKASGSTSKIARYSANEDIDDILCRVVRDATRAEINRAKHDCRLSVSYLLLLLSTIIDLDSQRDELSQAQTAQQIERQFKDINTANRKQYYKLKRYTRASFAVNLAVVLLPLLLVPALLSKAPDYVNWISLAVSAGLYFATVLYSQQQAKSLIGLNIYIAFGVATVILPPILSLFGIELFSINIPVLFLYLCCIFVHPFWRKSPSGTIRELLWMQRHERSRRSKKSKPQKSSYSG